MVTYDPQNAEQDTTYPRQEFKVAEIGENPVEGATQESQFIAMLDRAVAAGAVLSPEEARSIVRSGEVPLSVMLDAAAHFPDPDVFADSVMTKILSPDSYHPDIRLPRERGDIEKADLYLAMKNHPEVFEHGSQRSIPYGARLAMEIAGKIGDDDFAYKVRTNQWCHEPLDSIFGRYAAADTRDRPLCEIFPERVVMSPQDWAEWEYALLHGREYQDKTYRPSDPHNPSSLEEWWGMEAEARDHGFSVARLLPEKERALYRMNLEESKVYWNSLSDDEVYKGLVSAQGDDIRCALAIARDRGIKLSNLWFEQALHLGWFISEKQYSDGLYNNLDLFEGDPAMLRCKIEEAIAGIDDATSRRYHTDRYARLRDELLLEAS